MLRVSSKIAHNCDVDGSFRAKSVQPLPAPDVFGILQERRKRLLDVVLASILLVFLSPVLVVVAIAIKATSKGPVLFRQTRYGRFKRTFVINKFRTMNVVEDGYKFVQARQNDPRVTKLGKLLRRSSIDELPQLWNVILGEMSLVGPRPHAISMDDDYSRRIPGYGRRYLMRPGMTGLAQCTGFRGETKNIDQMVGRVNRDIDYVRNRNMMLDLKIMTRTIICLLKQDAY